ncbi:Uncharacterised protein [BD1-7 clade bacterium]|uniref:Thioesterase n=1 Tax=BD1-7 clade bacterium TaxID=2029982 RepID=A0A5S9NQA8_9GAMM|nr:Uncharacterised protein [BD1-7 clade bacterium]
MNTNTDASTPVALYSKSIEVRWADCDANKHMRHSAYADLFAHTRLGFLNHIGLTQTFMSEHALGPVLFREETLYQREAHVGELLTIVIEAVEPTEFSKSIQIAQRLYKENGELSATHYCTFAWMDLTARKIIALPEQIAAFISTVPSAEAS